ncbi:MAG: hypothetical protein R3C16_04790 [Hyphomonadaceae bacterium]
MRRALHPIAGFVAMATIATFWLATAASEISGNPAFIALVKALIPWGFFVLVPALAMTGGTGFALSGGRRGGVLGAKLRRMPIIAANGLFVLIPSALFLAAKARNFDFDAWFVAVQTVELIAGAANLWLLALNARDGFRMTKARRAAAQR